MKTLIFITMLSTTASAMAFPHLSTKEKVRLELWVYGLSDQQKKISPTPKDASRKPLPVELEEALRKF